MRLIDADTLFETLVTGDIRETQQFCYPCKKVLEAIDAQPTVDPQPQWIPVTERLPEQTGKYLVSVKNGNVYAGTYDSYGGQFQCAAVAWMPLPEPYES